MEVLGNFRKHILGFRKVKGIDLITFLLSVFFTSFSFTVIIRSRTGSGHSILLGLGESFLFRCRFLLDVLEQLFEILLLHWFQFVPKKWLDCLFQPSVKLHGKILRFRTNIFICVSEYLGQCLQNRFGVDNLASEVVVNTRQTGQCSRNHLRYLV